MNRWVLLISYFIIMTYNMFTMMLHPEMHVTISNTILSAIFLIIWLSYIIRKLSNKQYHVVLSHVGIISFVGLLSYVTESFDMMTGISGLLYGLTIGPFYGLNIFCINYHIIGLIVGIFALLDFGLLYFVLYKKRILD